MATNRTIKELLTILRDNADVVVIRKSFCGIKWEKQRIYSGLCSEIYYLRIDNIINDFEKYCLYDYIKNNKPIYVFHNAYGWKPKLWLPRLRWLNKHIKSPKPF